MAREKTKKTVVIRFRQAGNFDRTTQAKVAQKDFDADAGVVKVRVDGAADMNKEIGFVRSRFLEVLSWMASDKRGLNPDTFKTNYLELQKHLEARGRNLHKRKVPLEAVQLCRKVWGIKRRPE